MMTISLICFTSRKVSASKFQQLNEQQVINKLGIDTTVVQTHASWPTINIISGIEEYTPNPLT